MYTSSPQRFFLVNTSFSYPMRRLPFLTVVNLYNLPFPGIGPSKAASRKCLLPFLTFNGSCFSQ